MKRKPDPKFIAYWEGVRKKGMLRFIVIQGLVFGVIGFLVTSLLDLNEKSFSEIYFSSYTLLRLGFWLLGGFLIMGPVQWWMNNLQYKRMQENGAE